jgi:transposase
MARKRETIDKLNESPILIERLNTEKGWQRERLLVLKSAMEGDTLKVLSNRFSRSHTTIQDWINRFRDGGVAKLLDKQKGNGPTSKLTPEMEAGMREELAKGKWRTARDAWNWLSENHDVSDLKESVIYKYLGKCEGRLKATRPCNPKKDEDQEAAFRVELADKMEVLNIPLDKNVRLWVYDEMRYGLHPLTRKMWCLRGVRAIAPSRIRFQNGYLYGALEVGGGDSSEFLFTPNLNKQWDLKFLEQLSKSDLDSIHVVIGDGAGFHHKGADNALPENIRIITLPAYSPELNPAEKLWDIVKDGICNKDWEDLEELEEAITTRIKPYWEEPHKVGRLIGSSYLTTELNATGREELIHYN